MANRTTATTLALGALLVVLCAPALADGRDGHDRPGRDRPAPAQRAPMERAPRGRDVQPDRRYDHDRWYPRPGIRYDHAPPGGYYRAWHGDRYYFHGGVWYRPWGPRYLVVRPPLGIGIEVLPPFYTTVWFGGIPYYYADDTYYLWEPARREYVVTEPPSGAASTSAAADSDFYAYPKNGQGEQQQADDRYACHQWAREQTGFDPTQPPPGGDTAAKRADYRRAERTCLEGRGYSVN